MNTLQSSADLSWLRETDPVYLTWEWWQWSLAFLVLLISWVAVAGGWVAYIATGDTGWSGVGVLVAVLGAGSAWLTTLALMRHFAERGSAYWMAVLLIGCAIALWIFLANWFSVPYGARLGTWAPPAALGVGAIAALVMDGAARLTAGTPAWMFVAAIAISIFAVAGGTATTSSRN